jgi:hypothetical protein
VTQPSPDGVTLDAMILGTDTDAERDAWRDLLASPRWRDSPGARRSNAAHASTRSRG